ncbi:MAG: Tat pathway signal protein, partial [Streptomycetaceae bacterium]|nr:Tat pathway signal protein [Streptomycetaceae bacterium]
MNKPRRTLAVILGVVLVAGAGGWYVGQQVQSPAEAAASHQAPPASLITVPVESRVLTNSVVTHGTISFESPMPVNLSGAVGTAS